MPSWLDSPEGQEWATQFAANHGGGAPGTQSQENLGQAVANKVWGDTFAETYGRAPSQADWEQRYYSEQRGGGTGIPGTTFGDFQGAIPVLGIPLDT